MSSTKKTESQSNQSTTDNFTTFRGQLADGVDVMLRMHNDWLDVVTGQQEKLFSAMRDGVGRVENALGQATDRYRKASEAWSTRVSDAAR